jgi:hypothetical protein
LAACRPVARQRIEARPADAAAAKATDQLLGVFPGPAYRYELSYARPVPGQKERSLELTLRAGSSLLDSLVVGTDWGSDYTPDQIDAEYGVASDTPAWMGDRSLGVAARTVNLGPGALGLLLTQRMGSEYPERHHALYLARAEKLVQVWSDDGTGDQWDVRVSKPAGASYQNLAILTLTRADPRGEPKGFRAARLHWDPGRAGIVVTPLPARDLPLGLLYRGPYRTRPAAWAALSNAAGCESPGEELLPGRAFPGLGLRGVIWGRMFLDPAESSAARKALSRCPPRFTPKFIEYVDAPNHP